VGLHAESGDTTQWASASALGFPSSTDASSGATGSVSYSSKYAVSSSPLVLSMFQIANLNLNAISSLLRRGNREMPQVRRMIHRRMAHLLGAVDGTRGTLALVRGKS
jgi:hypothetical protein